MKAFIRGRNGLAHVHFNEDHLSLLTSQAVVYYLYRSVVFHK